MSWIQENKFVAGLGGVTAVLALGILYVGNSQGNQYEEKIAEYEALQFENGKLKKSKPFPSQKNLDLRKTNIDGYIRLIEDVRATFTGFSVGELEKTSPEQFNDYRVKMDRQLREAFTKAGTTLPEKTGFGFEKYATDAVRPDATALLRYQMTAFEWLLTELARTKPEELNNIRRTELDVETGKIAEPTPPRGAKAKRAKAPTAEEKAYTLMPMELSFTASEPALRDFLKAMVNSEQYFFSIRALRIRNEKQTAPTVADAGFDPGAAAPVAPADPEGNPFIIGDGGDGDGEGDAPDQPVPQPVAPAGARILKQVLGDENLQVFIRFDIVFIKGAKKEEAPAPAATTPGS